MEAPVDEVLDALESMVFQYFIEYPDGNLGHSFMSAGEEATEVLVKYRPEQWEYASEGRGSYGLHFIGRKE